MYKVPEFCDEFLSHPMLVQSDDYGFPILEDGKYYMIIHSSYRDGGYTTHRYGGRVWRCIGAMGHKKHPSEFPRYSTSCLMSSPTLCKTGITYFGGQYVWFGAGGNVVIELPEEQQKVYAQFEQALNEAKSPCDYRWDLRRVNCNV
ncbi:MAG: hypothetical protein ACRDC4_15215 [Plesiomonas sp.]